MIVLGTRAHGMQRRRHLRLADGFEYFKGEWMECGDDPALSPTMFLVEQGPHSKLEPHFHRQNEFQLVVQGDGKLGSHDVAAFTVHYAGAFTGYGPVQAGPCGLSYFTIRAVLEAGAVVLPQGRSEMIRGPKRQLHSAPFDALSAQDLAHKKVPESIDIFVDQADRLAAQRLLIPPGQAGSALDPSDSSGVFIVVLEGSISHEGTTLGKLETIFISADEPALTLHAGEHGAEVLSLRIPVKAKEYR